MGLERIRLHYLILAFNVFSLESQLFKRVLGILRLDDLWVSRGAKKGAPSSGATTAHQV